MVGQGAIVGSYTVEGLLGRGATASMYAARHVTNGRLVALKLLSAERPRSSGPRLTTSAQTELGSPLR
jgi:serine/threonine-protein kinase